MNDETSSECIAAGWLVESCGAVEFYYAEPYASLRVAELQKRDLNVTLTELFTKDPRMVKIAPQHEKLLNEKAAENIRQFASGATRAPLGDKLQYEGYINPLVLQRFAQYMKKHQVQSDGTQRAADNWQAGIPKDSLIDSATRHYLDWWLHHRKYPHQAVEPLEDALCAVMFNAMAYLLSTLSEKE